MNPPTATTPSTRHSAIAAAFVRAFGAEPGFCSIAPGRVNLIGEHTDYSEGFVLPMAIDRACTAAARVVEQGGFRFRSLQEPEEAAFPGRIGAAEAQRTLPRWSMYPVGVAMLLAQRAAAEGRAAPPVDLLVSSDVPLGSGLSSSAALEVSTAVALAAAWKLGLTPLEIAQLCQRAEHEFAGVPCGIMDQFASAHGREGHAMLLDCRTLAARQVPLPPRERAAIVVCNSNVRHELSGGEYAERRAWCEGAARAMGARTLRDATPESLAAPGLAVSENERRAARHVITENARAAECAELLIAGAGAGWPARTLKSVGERMVASHRSLRDDLRVSCEELDALVELAMSVPGVHGSRMTGGGFGGCTVTLVDAERIEELRHRLNAGYRERFGLTCTIFVPIASAGARVLSSR